MMVIQTLSCYGPMATRRHFTRSIMGAQVLFSVSAILGVLCAGGLGSCLFADLAQGNPILPAFSDRLDTGHSAAG